MANEDRMYELEYPAPAVNDTAAGETDGPTLIVALHGYADAGQAVEHSADHLKAALDNRLIASFNADELIDYRSRRPAVTLDNDAPMEIENLDLDMRVLRDNADKAFLLLSGPEPDLRWQAFTKAVTDLVEKFDVKQTVALYGAPMPVPHTRPMVITAHGNSPELVSRMFRLDSTMMVPGAAQMYIERALAKADRNVAGYTAHVPHYLANSPYPQATLELLESVASVTGLKLPLRALEADAARLNQQIEEQVNDSEEIAQVVGQLENQYDAYMERYREEHPQAIMPGEQGAPTGEELSEEFERFLDALGHENSWRDQILTADINDREDNFGRDSSGPQELGGPSAGDSDASDDSDDSGEAK